MRHVGISLGKLRRWHEGLGEFSRQLGLALAERAPMLRAQHGIALHFHLPARWHGVFGDGVGYLPAWKVQEWLHVAPRRFDLWHGLHQRIKLRPPVGARRTLQTVHDLQYIDEAAEEARAARHAWLARRLSPRDALVAITHHVAGDLRQRLSEVKAPVHVIHNGVTDLSGAAQSVIAALQGRSFLLHLSRMAPNKNVAALLGLAAAWPEQYLVLAGNDNRDVREVERLAQQRGLRNVLVLRDLDEAQKAWAYAHCAGFLFPSLSEGFGLPPIEAMHFGKPVFLSRLTSLPEVGGDAAFYFDGFEPAAMRAVVEAGLRAAQAPGFAGRVTAHARGFSWQRCADEYVALYLRMLEGR